MFGPTVNGASANTFCVPCTSAPTVPESTVESGVHERTGAKRPLVTVIATVSESSRPPWSPTWKRTRYSPRSPNPGVHANVRVDPSNVAPLGRNPAEYVSVPPSASCAETWNASCTFSCVDLSGTGASTGAVLLPARRVATVSFTYSVSAASCVSVAVKRSWYTPACP